MRDRSAALTDVGLFIGSALLFGFGIFASSPMSSTRGLWLRLVIALGAGLVFAGSMAVFRSRSSTRAGGRGAVRERSKAVRDGVVPADADESWLPGLHIRLQNLRQIPWLLAGLTVLTAGIGLWRLGEPNLPAAIYWFVLALIAAALLVRHLVSARGSRPVIERFIVEIAQRDL